MQVEHKPLKTPDKKDFHTSLLLILIGLLMIGLSQKVLINPFLLIKPTQKKGISKDNQTQDNIVLSLDTPESALAQMQINQGLKRLNPNQATRINILSKKMVGQRKADGSWTEEWVALWNINYPPSKSTLKPNPNEGKITFWIDFGLNKPRIIEEN